MKFKSTFEGIFFCMLIDVEINGKNHLAIFIQQELRLQGGLDNKHYPVFDFLILFYYSKQYTNRVSPI